ncbi:MAG: BrxA/BrxB family bacilliredoxin [Planctomycetota bacterium]
MYDPVLVQPLRDEVTRLGAKELSTREDVDIALRQAGTTLVFVNSVCGCAAGGARPGLALSLINGNRPDHLVTMFAGVDQEAIERLRELLHPHEITSAPEMALVKDGAVTRIWRRQDIVGRDPSSIAHSLMKAFEKYC